MADPRALRQRRLTNEYNELMCMSGDVIHIEPLGDAPYEKYRITFNIRTVISDKPNFRDKTVCLLTIPPGYPKDRPKIAVDDSSKPPPWHPNWWTGGTWCEGYWTQEESLVSFIYRCAKTIQFSHEYTDSNIDSAANKSAILFWNANKNNVEIIPTDSKALPMVDMQTPTISIIRTNKG
jgi:ubiquitin-protein ligase